MRAGSRDPWTAGLVDLLTHAAGSMAHNMLDGSEGLDGSDGGWLMRSTAG